MTPQEILLTHVVPAIGECVSAQHNHVLHARRAARGAAAAASLA